MILNKNNAQQGLDTDKSTDFKYNKIIIKEYVEY